jgi:hypothetical protein
LPYAVSGRLIGGANVPLFMSAKSFALSTLLVAGSLAANSTSAMSKPSWDRSPATGFSPSRTHLSTKRWITVNTPGR